MVNSYSANKRAAKSLLTLREMRGRRLAFCICLLVVGLAGLDCSKLTAQESRKLPSLDGSFRLVSVRNADGSEAKGLLIAGDKPIDKDGISDPLIPTPNEGATAVAGEMSSPIRVFGSDMDRALIVVDPINSTGAATTIDEHFADESKDATLILKPCAKVKGKIISSRFFQQPTIVVHYKNQAVARALVDRNGNFEISDLVPGLVYIVRVEGPPGVISSKALRRDFFIGQLEPAQVLDLGKFSFRGLTKITGTVVDEKTGEPIVGAALKCRQRSATVYTDDQGKFSISPLSLTWDYHSKFRRISVLPPKGDTGYVESGHVVEIEQEVAPNGPGPINLEIRLPRSRILRGRIVDAETGKPVQAILTYSNWSCMADKDGNFSLAVGKDRGQLAVLARFKEGYYRLIEIESRVNKIHEFDFADPDFKNLDVEIKLQPSTIDKIPVLMPNDRPASNYQLCGETRIREHRFFTFPKESTDIEKTDLSGEVTLYGLDEPQQRIVMIYKQDESGAYGASRFIDSDNPNMEVYEPIVLEKCASVSGRVADVTDFFIRVFVTYSNGDSGYSRQYNARIEKQDDGKFTVGNLIPNVQYSIAVYTLDDIQNLVARGVAWDYELIEGAPSKLLTIPALNPDQSLDVGDIELPSEQPQR